MTWQPTEADWKEFELTKQWWAEALKQLIGWPEEHIVQWIQHKHELYTTRSAIWCCLHVPPVDDLMPVLIPEVLRNQLRQRDRKELFRLEDSLLEAIENGKGLECYYPPYPDWEACRQRINKVVAEYGYSLPGPENPPDNRDE